MSETATPTLLLVDDEDAIRAGLAAALKRANFHVIEARDGEEALRLVEERRPDLIVLDILMPKLDGREVCRRLRQAGNWTPVIMLTQISATGEKISSLEEGADDYLNKPFSSRELLARIAAVLRRARADPVPLSSAWRLAAGRLILDRRARRAVLDGATLAVKPKTLALLEYFMTHPDELLTRERLLNDVWGWDYPAGQRTVDTRVAELRRALSDDAEHPAFIETAPNEGYRFISPVRVEP